ncbi:MAG: InlB B-repeat-containing protein, partial [Eubacterium sp.]|nr:InlB B-repeat-containing protein [Eubacterium sp.]
MKKRLVSILLCVVLVFALGTLAFAADIAITAQPQNVTAAENDTVTFSIAATGSGLSYRWQYQPAGSSTWTNAGVTGCKTDTITVVANTYRDGQSYRCMVTDAAGSTVYSDPAVLTLSSVAPVKITQQPADASGAVGSNVMMHVAAQGDGLKYQWQYQMAGKTTWANCGLEGRLTDTLTVPVTTARDGASYRCVVTDANGNAVESKAAKLTVKDETGIAISAQPVGAEAEIGESVQFSVQATGEGLKYQWQYHMAGKTVWANCGLEGRLTDTLTVPVTAARDGASYRCVVTNANGEMVTSDAAILTAKEPAPPVEEGFTVTFVNYDDSVIATETVASGKSAKLPANPEKSGADFLGWSGNYANVTQDETIRAVYSDEKNVFVIDSASGSVGDTVTVLVSIDGKVKTCGFDINLFYDPALQLVSYDDDLDLDIVV